MNKLSPMMEQYFKIKEKHQDCILFFRLGDFYEMFYEDAKIGSKELELTLTGKNCGQEERAPMCGVPFHSADNYISKLVEKGYKVAICEQIEDPATAKGLVKRDVIQIVTPGTVMSASMLKENENNYIASVYQGPTGMSISYCDISTGELYTTQLLGTNTFEIIQNELVKINAKEIIVNESFENFYSTKEIEAITGAFINKLNDSYFALKTAINSIKNQFDVVSVNGLGLNTGDLTVLSLGALLGYLFETQKQNLKQLTHFEYYDMGKHMSLDKATLRNLEITETLYDKKIQGSLLGVLDKTHTAMGSRKIKQWLREPLNNVSEINKRLDAVEELTDKIIIRNNLTESLKSIYDFERLTGRIAGGNANGKDLIALKTSVFVVPEIKNNLSYVEMQELQDINSKIDSLSNVFDLINQSITEDPPFTIKDGSIIKDGYSKDLDALKSSISNGKQWIANLENIERERTGIRNLKVGFNKVFGYYIEITKSNYEQIPDNYIRKQTLSNCERFITPELKEMESLVLNAETKINQLEYELFTHVRETIQESIVQIQTTSKAIAELDVLCSFAEASSKLGYIKPTIDDSLILQIEKGRHPVIEEITGNGLFVSNDTYLNNTDTSLLLITGPNMSGKSTYMRQTALIVLMAQAGCFVPAEAARIGVVDRIFTRIGASDNLSQGQSTFYVEMSEMAYILNCSKDKSLIILDEIGRGTSTYDGLSIAWATVNYLCNEKTHIRTLFATHYHELTVLEDKIYGVANLNVDVSEENGNIVFLHKIVSGSASRSYGIHVAKIAGVPKELLINAQNILTELEKEKEHISISDANINEYPPIEDQQISLFSDSSDNVIKKIKELNLMEITPSEAIKILEELKDAIHD